MHMLSDSRLSDLTGNSWLVAVGSGIFLSFLFGVLVCLFPSSFFLLLLLLLLQLPLLLLKPYFLPMLTSALKPCENRPKLLIIFYSYFGCDDDAVVAPFLHSFSRSSSFHVVALFVAVCVVVVSVVCSCSRRRLLLLLLLLLRVVVVVVVVVVVAVVLLCCCD